VIHVMVLCIVTLFSVAVGCSFGGHCLLHLQGEVRDANPVPSHFLSDGLSVSQSVNSSWYQLPFGVHDRVLRFSSHGVFPDERVGLFCHRSESLSRFLQNTFCIYIRFSNELV
jgi:hypothetical protein